MCDSTPEDPLAPVPGLSDTVAGAVETTRVAALQVLEVAAAEARRREVGTPVLELVSESAWEQPPRRVIRTKQTVYCCTSQTGIGALAVFKTQVTLFAPENDERFAALSRMPELPASPDAATHGGWAFWLSSWANSSEERRRLWNDHVRYCGGVPKVAVAFMKTPAGCAGGSGCTETPGSAHLLEPIVFSIPVARTRGDLLYNWVLPCTALGCAHHTPRTGWQRTPAKKINRRGKPSTPSFPAAPSSPSPRAAACAVVGTAKLLAASSGTPPRFPEIQTVTGGVVATIRCSEDPSLWPQDLQRFSDGPAPRVELVVSRPDEAPSIRVTFDDPVLASRHFDLVISVTPESPALARVFAESLDRAGNALPLTVSRISDTTIMQASVKHWSSILITTEPFPPPKLHALVECDVPAFDPDCDPAAFWDVVEPFIAARREGRMTKSASCRLSHALGLLGERFEAQGKLDRAEDCFFEAALSSARAHGIESRAHALFLNNFAAALFNSFRCSKESALEIMRIVFNLLRSDDARDCGCSSEDARETIELNLASLESQSAATGIAPLVHHQQQQQPPVLRRRSTGERSGNKCFCKSGADVGGDCEKGHRRCAIHKDAPCVACFRDELSKRLAKLFSADSQEDVHLAEALGQFEIILQGSRSEKVKRSRNAIDSLVGKMGGPCDVVFFGNRSVGKTWWAMKMCGIAAGSSEHLTQGATFLARSFEHCETASVALEIVHRSFSLDSDPGAAAETTSDVARSYPECVSKTEPRLQRIVYRIPETFGGQSELTRAIADQVAKFERTEIGKDRPGSYRVIRVKGPFPNLKKLGVRVVDTPGIDGGSSLASLMPLLMEASVVVLMPATSGAVPTEQAARKLSQFLPFNSAPFLEHPPRIVQMMNVTHGGGLLEVLFGNGSAGRSGELAHFAPGTPPMEIEAQYTEVAQQAVESVVLEALSIPARRGEPVGLHEASRRASALLGFDSPQGGYDPATSLARICELAHGDQRKRLKLSAWRLLFRLASELLGELRGRRTSPRLESPGLSATVEAARSSAMANVRGAIRKLCFVDAEEAFSESSDLLLSTEAKQVHPVDSILQAAATHILYPTVSSATAGIVDWVRRKCAGIGVADPTQLADLDRALEDLCDVGFSERVVWTVAGELRDRANERFKGQIPADAESAWALIEREKRQVAAFFSELTGGKLQDLIASAMKDALELPIRELIQGFGSSARVQGNEPKSDPIFWRAVALEESLGEVVSGPRSAAFPPLMLKPAKTQAPADELLSDAEIRCDVSMGGSAERTIAISRDDGSRVIKIVAREEDFREIAEKARAIAENAASAFTAHAAQRLPALDAASVFPVFVITSDPARLSQISLVLDGLPAGSLVLIVLNGDDRAVRDSFKSHPLRPLFVETPKGQGIGRTRAQVQLLSKRIFSPRTPIWLVEDTVSSFSGPGDSRAPSSSGRVLLFCQLVLQVQSISRDFRESVTSWVRSNEATTIPPGESAGLAAVSSWATGAGDQGLDLAISDLSTREKMKLAHRLLTERPLEAFPLFGPKVREALRSRFFSGASEIGMVFPSEGNYSRSNSTDRASGFSHVASAAHSCCVLLNVEALGRLAEVDAEHMFKGNLLPREVEAMHAEAKMNPSTRFIGKSSPPAALKLATRGYVGSGKFFSQQLSRRGLLCYRVTLCSVTSERERKGPESWEKRLFAHEISLSSFLRRMGSVAGEREEAEERLRKRLEEFGLKKLADVPEGGDCLFSSVALQTEFGLADDLRDEAVKWLRANGDALLDNGMRIRNIEPRVGDWQVHLDKIAKPGERAGVLGVIALANVCQRTVLLFDSADDPRGDGYVLRIEPRGGPKDWTGPPILLSLLGRSLFEPLQRKTSSASGAALGRRPSKAKRKASGDEVVTAAGSSTGKKKTRKAKRKRTKAQAKEEESDSEYKDEGEEDEDEDDFVDDRPTRKKAKGDDDDDDGL